MNNFPDRLQSLRKSLRLTQSQMAEKMGLSMSYIHQLETGKRTPSDSVDTLVRMLETQLSSGLIGPELQAEDSGSTLRDDVVSYRPSSRMIPVVGWAHAGSAMAYDELPASWQHKIPTECHDTKAFAVELEGDSMEGIRGLSFRQGDVLVVQPSELPYSGCLVVARFVDDGIIFRQYEQRGPQIILAPLNERYQITTHSVEEFSWIYPVWGRWTQLWKR